MSNTKVYSYGIRFYYRDGVKTFAVMQLHPNKMLCYNSDPAKAMAEARSLMQWHFDKGERATIDIPNSVWVEINI